MRIIWIGIGAYGVINIGAALAAHYNHDYQMVTIIWNCLIPVLSLFLVCLLNEMQRLGHPDNDNE